MTNNYEVVMYVGGEEYLFVNVDKFEIDGEVADPTEFNPEFQLVAMGSTLDDLNWDDAEWVVIDDENKIRFLATGSSTPLAAGHYWLFLRLTGGAETIIRQAGGIHLRTSA